MTNIVTIGGGEIADKETLAIDQYVCELTGRSNPNALFIPTASTDAAGYCENFRSIYGDCLGCEVDVLALCGDQYTEEFIRRKIQWADLIYVGGGDTRKLLDEWARYGLDRIIRENIKENCVLVGLSAGAICWYESGLSDADRFTGNSGWSFISLNALGWLPGMFCPHLDAERRHGALIDWVFSSGKSAVACDNGAALHWSPEGARVVTASSRAFAYQFIFEKGAVSIVRYADGDSLSLSDDQPSNTLARRSTRPGREQG